MSSIGKAIGSVVGGITGSTAATKGAENAADTQASAAQAGVDEQKRQFDQLVQLMSPYVTAGNSALTGQQNLLGLNGNYAQGQAIDSIANSDYYKTTAAQGNDAILQNASATGGLRGGNTQSALAQYQPALLNQLVQQQYSNLGGLTQLGQASAAGQASAGLTSASSISQLLAQQGQAVAGGQIAAGNSQQNSLSSALKLGSAIGGFF